MARISLTPSKALSYRIAEWFLRRQFGAMLDPVRAVGHNIPVMHAFGALEQRAAKWNKLNGRLIWRRQPNWLPVVLGLRLLDDAHTRHSPGEDRSGSAVAQQPVIHSAGAVGDAIRRSSQRDAADRRR